MLFAGVYAQLHVTIFQVNLYEPVDFWSLSLNEMYSTDVLSSAEFTELCLADGQL